MQKHTQEGRHTDITPPGTLLRYVQLPWLMQQYPRIPVFALYNFLSGFFSIGLMATFAGILHAPFIFPSLGPTAFHYSPGRVLQAPLRAMPLSAISSAPLLATSALS